MEATLTETGKKKLEQLRAMPGKLIPAVAAGLFRGLQIAAGRVQKERFTGQGPFPISENRIGLVTGRLRGSILVTAPVVRGGEVTALAGTAVVYFPRHEFGFNGTENVKAHTRRVTTMGLGGQRVKNSRKPRKTDKVPLLVTVQNVKAHTRKVNIPERRMLCTGLAQHGPEAIGREIEREIAKVV